jgi:hypothetical protein
MTVELTDRECDLISRVLTHVIAECNERISVSTRIDRLAITWLLDEVEALRPKFRPE